MSSDGHRSVDLVKLGAPIPAPILEQQSEMSIRDIGRILLKSKWLIAGCTILCTALSLGYIVWKTPVYQSSAEIQIDSSRLGSLGLGDLLNAGFEDDDVKVQTDIEILQSETVAMAALAALPPAEQRAFAGFPVDFEHPEKLTPAERDALIGKLGSKLKCKRVPNTQIVQVSFRDPDPQLAKNVANNVVDAFVKGTFQSRYKSVEQVSGWLSDQMKGLKERAANAQKKLSAFQQKNNVLVDSGNSSSNTTIDKLKQISDQLTQAQADRIAKEARYRVAAAGNNPALLDSLVPDTALELLQSQQTQALNQYAQLSSKFGPGYPPLAQMKDQIAELNARINGELKTLSQRLEQEYNASLQTETMLRKEYNDQSNQAFMLDRKVAEYALLKDEGDSDRNLLNMLQSKLQQAGVDAGLGSVNTTIVDRASIPSMPTEPQKPLTLAIGMCLGLVTGIGSAFLRAANENNVESVDQIEAALGLPTLALVPQFSKKEATGLDANLLPDVTPSYAIAARRPSSQAAESYRTLRNSVLLSSLDRPLKIITFTSSLPGEGKSTSAVNFAVVLAQKGAKVLLVDADLRRPSLSKTFNVEKSDGLSSCLLGDVKEDPIITPMASLPEFKFIPSGPRIPAPSEALASARFRNLVEKWKENYDYIILDSAPVLGISDSIPMASWADTVLVVTRYGTTPIKALIRTRNVLARANARIDGFILNGAQQTSDSYYLSRYRYKGYYV